MVPPDSTTPPLLFVRQLGHIGEKLVNDVASFVSLLDMRPKCIRMT
jgi:hypothetical protein